MKHHFTKLVTFSFAAMLLASCSDSIDNPLVPNPGEVTKNILGEEVTSITDPLLKFRNKNPHSKQEADV